MHAYKAVVNFVFPPLCLHCETKLMDHKLLFCKGCSGFFELIDPSSRCQYCFAENGRRQACAECLRKKRWQVTIASALDYQEAVCTLVKKLKYGSMPYLAKTAEAFMTAQFFRLAWPQPDLIVPVPRRHWFQGRNHAHLLATCLAKRLHTKCMPVIQRRAGDFSQARLSKSQRESLISSGFSLKRNSSLDGKIVLLVDDVVTTGTTLRHCAEALSEGFPARIFALSFARTTQD